MNSRPILGTRAYPRPAGLEAPAPIDGGLSERIAWQDLATGARTFHAALARLRAAEPELTADQAKDRLWLRLGITNARVIPEGEL